MKAEIKTRKQQWAEIIGTSKLTMIYQVTYYILSIAVFNIFKAFVLYLCMEIVPCLQNSIGCMWCLFFETQYSSHLAVICLPGLKVDLLA